MASRHGQGDVSREVLKRVAGTDAPVARVGRCSADRKTFLAAAVVAGRSRMAGMSGHPPLSCHGIRRSAARRVRCVEGVDVIACAEAQLPMQEPREEMGAAS